MLEFLKRVAAGRPPGFTFSSGYGYEMNVTVTLLLIAFTALSACASPEARRTRSGGPGADVGNRAKVVEMHGGSLPYWKTLLIITTKHGPIETADRAYELNRR